MSTAVSPCGLQSISLTRRMRGVSAAVQGTCMVPVSRRFYQAVSGGSLARTALRRREFLGAPLKGLVPRNGARASAPDVVTCVLEGAASEQLVEKTENPPSRIWLSDVVVRKRRNYFKNRQWTTKDLTYAGFMAFMHGLCLFAPATFSWNASGVFVGLYVITGMLGITLSYHRNLSHKSFKVPKWLEYTFAYCGVQAVQVILQNCVFDRPL